ncbi:reverse gyrase [Sulfurihydrogenibium sp.]|uniref:reverse gyrase n=1 Tax=Sulfurihydrogenibium sp. TaxID=2053621 RepID=UPI0026026CB1|nr:reverse gyrase [Sulfurihydrogenibium sp.]
MISAIFEKLCPNCYGEISSYRLEKGLPCKKCLPEEDLDVCQYIKKGELRNLCDIEEKLTQWQKHFENYIHSSPWSLQNTWAKRVFLKHSFVLLAPTGIGKTSFGISMASFLIKEGKRCYILLPTKLLVKQVYERVRKFGVEEKDILATGIEKNNKEKEQNKERLKNGDFKILITTSMFLYKNFEIYPRDFDFIFVDDVDSFVKTAKNIDKALYIMGFSEKDINTALEVIKLKAKPNKTEEDWSKINQLSDYLSKQKEKIKGVLIVSSATSNPKSSRVRLFRELLGFEISTPTFYLRNIVDSYDEEFSYEKLIYWIKTLGNGGLVFVPSDKGKEFVEEVVKYLNKHKIKALSYEDLDDKNIKRYESGKIQVLVGISSYRNPLARGLDLPHVIRYAVFFGVPKISISLKLEENLSHMLWALTSIRSYIVKKFPEITVKINQWITQLQKYQYITAEFLQDKPQLQEKIQTLQKEIGEFLQKPEVIETLKSSDELTLKQKEDGYYLVVSDATGYLQASGRTSRLYAGGITKGLALVMIDEKSAFKHLTKRVKWFSEDIEFTNINNVNIPELIQQIDKDRELVKKFKEGIEIPQEKELLKPALVIVESPTKAKTIANFFGKPVRRKLNQAEVLETSMEGKYLMITASLGHILDLVKNIAYHGVIVKKDEITPIYETIEGKEDTIKDLRRLSIESVELYLATDPDPEGEKISWDLYELLKPIIKNIKRMEFHEVTKKAIVKAIQNPRDIDKNLVKAQIVRRVADRWVGFEYSQLLQKEFHKSWLSAGRVQTPVLGWIIKREEESHKKVYLVIVDIPVNEKHFSFDITFESKLEAKKFHDNLREVEIFIEKVYEESENPPPPYRTDTMLKDASDKYRFTLPQTMDLAQTLFELGYITYHRTDSIRVSDAGINLAKEIITQEFGENYFKPRVWGEGGAHECIRPTKNILPEDFESLILSKQIEGLNYNHLKLYKMIFNRFIASQMIPVKLKIADISIKALNFEIKERIKTQVVENGWNLVLDIDTKPLVEGKINVENYKKLIERPKVYLYTHGELVKDMKEKGIGRPSTYATIIAKLLERGYVIERKGFLIPTKLGKTVYNFLINNPDLKEFLSEEFTRKLEEIMDKIEEGQEDYKEVLKELFSEIKKV